MSNIQSPGAGNQPTDRKSQQDQKKSQQDQKKSQQDQKDNTDREPSQGIGTLNQRRQ